MKHFLKDYLQILIGLLIYVTGFTCFMLPYGITSGGISGVSALIYYATGFPAGWSYFIINTGLLLLALKVMGWRYSFRTILATAIVSLLIGVIQKFITDPETGKLVQLVGSQKFMACAIGGLMEGFGLALVFMAGGSTGGTDIIASCINKYWNISLGRMMLYLDILIVSSSFLVFHSQGTVYAISTMVYGYATMLISMNFLDFVINGAHQSVQFTIISHKHEEIAQAISEEVDRGVTLLHGAGWYTKEPRQVLLVMARKNESRRIFSVIRRIDHDAFVTMTNVEGVFGEGFDKIKRG